MNFLMILVLNNYVNLPMKYDAISTAAKMTIFICNVIFLLLLIVTLNVVTSQNHLLEAVLSCTRGLCLKQK